KYRIRYTHQFSDTFAILQRNEFHIVQGTFFRLLLQRYRFSACSADQKRHVHLSGLATFSAMQDILETVGISQRAEVGDYKVSGNAIFPGKVVVLFGGEIEAGVGHIGDDMDILPCYPSFNGIADGW